MQILNPPRLEPQLSLSLCAGLETLAIHPNLTTCVLQPQPPKLLRRLGLNPSGQLLLARVAAAAGKRCGAGPWRVESRVAVGLFGEGGRAVEWVAGVKEGANGLRITKTARA